MGEAMRDRSRFDAVRDAAVPAVLLFVLVLRTAGAVSDPDTFWHLATGRQLTRGWAFTGPDPLSPFTTGTWVRHQWLPGPALLQRAADGG